MVVVLEKPKALRDDLCFLFLTNSMEVHVANRKSKPATFDAMVKFFIHKYNIPTKRDIDRINERLDRLEKMIRAIPGTSAGATRGRRPSEKADPVSPASATEMVLALIRESKTETQIATIRERTGFDDKKLRNIIYRLNQMGKIARVNRGSYKVTE